MQKPKWSTPLPAVWGATPPAGRVLPFTQETVRKMTRRIPLGDGTTVTRSAATIRVTGKRDTLVFVEITQTILLKVNVPVMQDANADHWSCQICGKMPPLPDDKGCEFILENNGGERISFPAHEEVKPERDCYPVTGWKRLKVKGDALFTCDKCSTVVEKAVDQAIKKRQESLDAENR
jgi:hypothetical protein